MVKILDIVNGFLTSCLLTSLKSLMKRTVLSFFGVAKEGDAPHVTKSI